MCIGPATILAGLFPLPISLGALVPANEGCLTESFVLLGDTSRPNWTLGFTEVELQIGYTIGYTRRE